MSEVKRTMVAELLRSGRVDTEVVVKGWVRTKRGNKNVAFIALNDGSTINNIQIVADVAAFDGELLKRITTGACICARGLLVESVPASVSKYRRGSWRCTARPTPKRIRFRRRAIRSNSCVR